MGSPCVDFFWVVSECTDRGPWSKDQGRIVGIERAPYVHIELRITTYICVVRMSLFDIHVHFNQLMFLEYLRITSV